jgi:hypothetical protein
MAVYNKRKRKPRKHGSKVKPVAVERKPRDDEYDESQDRRMFWHCADNADCAARAWTWVDQLRATHNADAMMDLVHEAIYRGRPIGANASSIGRQYLLLKNGQLINLNIVMSMIDTVTARLTKRRPMPIISATNAGWSEKLFAQGTSHVLRRKVGGSDLAKASPSILRDMAIRGDGLIKAERNGGDISYKRIPIYEVVADPFEVEHGGPRTIAHVRPEPREVIAARYPKYEDEINDAPAYARNEPWASYAYQQQTVSDYIEVRELWHLPTSPGALDGEHIVTIKGVVICRELWRAPLFPIVSVQWCPPIRGEANTPGCRGSGLVEQLAGIQEQVNDILKDAREGLKNGSQLTIFMQRGANVDKHHLRKRHPKVVEFDGVEPHYVAPNPVSEQAIRILLLLIEQAYQVSGISQMAAQSKNTLGANASGKAIDTMDDLQSDRFAHVESSWQNGRVKLGEVTCYLARDLAEAANDNSKLGDFDEIPTIEEDKLAPWIAETDWSKLTLDDGKYECVLEPVNYLAEAREGRLAQVAELGKNGLIPDPSIQADLFDEPDIQRANRVILGPKHKLDNIMEALANVKVPLELLAPDQYTNLALGVLMAKGELNEAESKKRYDKEDPELEEVLERYRWWIERAKGEITKSKNVDAAPSLPGMMAANMGAAPNAMDLQPGLMGAPPMDPMAQAGAVPPAGPMPPMPMAA